MKQYKKIFPVELFKRGVMVFFGSRENVKRFVTEDYGDAWADESEWDVTSAYTFRLSADALIFAEKPINEGILVHEIVHATRHLLRLVDVDDEETECYLVEYLYNKIIPWFRTTSFLLDESLSQLSSDVSAQNQEK